MGFQIDNTEWIPSTVQEHATAWMEKINSLLEENNVTDAEGNIIKLSQNFANALYLQVLAGADRLAKNDEKLQAAINSFNIELCDDQQIENLLPIAAISRNPGSYSTQIITVTASDNGACTIPQGARLPFGDVFFVVNETTVISAGESENIATTCNTVGAIVALPGELNSFENEIPNVDSVTNPVSSVPGTEAESTASLRQRIINGDTIMYSLDGCKTALEGLTGVTYARVYFNPDPEDTVTLEGGVVLQPRHAYIVIHGASESIADTYAEYMNAPTQNGTGSGGTASTMVLTVAAEENDACVIPANSTVTYNGYTFKTTAETTILANQTADITTECTVVGAVEVPAGVIDSFDQTIAHVASVTNAAATPGEEPTARSQTWYTTSDQAIEIKYDIAKEQQVYVKIVLAEGADSSDEVQAQLKRDLIESSAGWEIGQTITSLLTSAPFVNCAYTTVAYTEVSTDGVTWSQVVTANCNVIPRLKSNNIEVTQI